MQHLRLREKAVAGQQIPSRPATYLSLPLRKPKKETLRSGACENSLPQTHISGEAPGLSHFPDLILRVRIRLVCSRKQEAQCSTPTCRAPQPGVCGEQGSIPWLGRADVPRGSLSQPHASTACEDTVLQDATSALLFPSIDPTAISQLEAAPSHPVLTKLSLSSGPFST